MLPDRRTSLRTSGARCRAVTRRDFFSTVGDGFCGAALASLLAADLVRPDAAQGAAGPRDVYDLRSRSPHFEPKATAVIHLFMNGGPSQVDLFDPKPVLRKYAGQPPSRELANDIEFADQMGGLMPSPFRFAKHGESGMELSELLPHLAGHVDDIALIRSVFGGHFNHEPSLFFMQSGRLTPGCPSLGSWVVYGLGSENQNLPAYVVLDDPKRLPINGIQNWQAGWLPPVYQGTRMRSVGSPILNLHSREEFPGPVQQLARSILAELDAGHRRQRPGYPELDARIASYELAARMQLAATDALDISREDIATREMYGLNNDLTASYGKRCLMARRLVERGVRFVQIFIEGQIWDTHFNLEEELRYCCGKTDKPVAALLTDLKRRGLLDSTLIVWGGEFGRMPLSQVSPGEKNAGRDHGPGGFSVWMAGGGVRGGSVYGATDEIGYRAVEDPVSVHDFHATILHQLGMDHTRLVFERNGLDERLSGVEPARALKEIVA